jgi:hypothetical protein
MNKNFLFEILVLELAKRNRHGIDRPYFGWNFSTALLLATHHIPVRNAVYLRERSPTLTGRGSWGPRNHHRCRCSKPLPQALQALSVRDECVFIS